MTCSSITTSAPDRRRRPRRTPGWLASALLIAALAAPAFAISRPDLVAQARAALARNDAIAAEVGLRRALAAGAPREAVAAYMGAALLMRDKPEGARAWLEPGAFTQDSAAEGFRQLARLERIDGDLAAAGEAFDQALAIAPRDATLWVEIGRLRYVSGESMLAIAAADHALTLDPENPRALEFKGQLVRDSQGLAAALPWFERGLRRQPRDIALLGEYAGTLGDLGQARKMLATTRLMLTIEPGNPRAYFLQAVLAARAGDIGLARGLFARTKGRFADLPVAQLLEGVLEMGAGNYGLASEALAKVVRAQPANGRAQLLLARAYALGGMNRLVVHDYAAAAARPEASPYLVALVARAYEADDRRDLAAPLLDRLAAPRVARIVPVANSEVGALLVAGDADGARALADRNLAAAGGSALNQAIAGDIRLADGDAAGALAHYRQAARVRLSESLRQRIAIAEAASGQGVPR